MGSKILVVEDERITAEDIKSGLENAGYRVPAMVSTGEDAVDKAGKLRPDLVLMDIRLKGKMDGIEAAGQIKLRYNIPVIYLTAYSDEYTIKRAKITEPSGYIVKDETGLVKKPFEESELHNVIEITLHRHKMEKDHDMLLSAMLKNINDAVISTNADGKIILMNSLAESLTGWDLNDANGKELREVFKPLDKHYESINDFYKNNELLKDNVILKNKQGEDIPVKCNLKIIRDNDYDINGFMLVFNH
ncbi:MAG: response regulator [Methanobacterium sp.]|uniref:response regulator n=1 Tax=Methanobacterium sp. TaxID=2164 RepID=UPI003C779B3A